MRLERSDSSADHWVFRDKYSNFNNFQISLFAMTGHGKSHAVERIASEFHRDTGGIVFFLTEKKRHMMEIGFNEFYPTANYHLNILKYQGRKPSRIGIKKYHPAVESIDKTRKLPDITFFTIPIKSLTEDDIVMLIGVNKTHESFKILKRLIDNANNSDTLNDILYKLRNLLTKKHEKGKIAFGSEDDFFLPVEISATEKNYQQIVSTMRPFSFNQDYIIANSESPFNLTAMGFKRILEKERNFYHVLSLGWIKNEHTKYFVITWFLNQILEHRHYAGEKPILIVFQEGRSFLPRTVREDEPYKKIAARLISEKIVTVRNMNISTLIEFQTFDGANKTIRESSTDHFFGRLLSDDSGKLGRAGYREEVATGVLSLRKGYFLKMSEEGELTEHYFMLSPYGHAEEGADYISRFSSEYPERCIDPVDSVNRIRSWKHVDIVKARERKIREEVEQIEKNRIGKVITAYDKKLSKRLEKLNDLIGRGLTNEEIASELKISTTTLWRIKRRLYAIEKKEETAKTKT